jgi:hypothetical protein
MQQGCRVALAFSARRRHNTSVDSEWVVTLVAVGVLFLGVAGSMARAARRGAEWQARVEEDWRRAADALGATLEVAGSGALAPRRLVLKHTIDDALAVADTNVPVDPGAPSHTRARARFVLGHGPAFQMRERILAEAPGVERDVLCDRDLARRVRMETRSPLAVRAMFSDAACASAAGFPRALLVRSDGRAVEVLWDGVEVDGAVLGNALGLAAELALSGVGPLRALAALEGASYAMEETGPTVRVERGEAEVQLSVEPSRRGPRYRASVRPRRALPDFSVRIDETGSVLDELPAGLIDPDDAASLRALGVCTIAASGEDAIELAWEDTPSLAAAEAAVRILAALATGSGRKGAFR